MIARKIHVPILKTKQLGRTVYAEMADRGRPGIEEIYSTKFNVNYEYIINK